MQESRAIIEGLTGKIADIFAFPKGRFTAENCKHLEQAGWLGAVSTEEGIIQPSDNPYHLKRNSVDSTTTMLQFKAKLSDSIAVYVAIRDYFEV